MDPGDFIEENLDLVEKCMKITRERGVECGFLICACGDRWAPRTVCTGTECELSGSECPEGCESIGWFHTHTEGSPKPSPGDILMDFVHGHVVQCIASEDEVVCYLWEPPRVPGLEEYLEQLRDEYWRHAVTVEELKRERRFDSEFFDAQHRWLRALYRLQGALRASDIFLESARGYGFYRPVCRIRAV